MALVLLVVISACSAFTPKNAKPDPTNGNGGGVSALALSLSETQTVVAIEGELLRLGYITIGATGKRVLAVATRLVLEQAVYNYLLEQGLNFFGVDDLLSDAYLGAASSSGFIAYFLDTIMYFDTALEAAEVLDFLSKRTPSTAGKAFTRLRMAATAAKLQKYVDDVNLGKKPQRPRGDEPTYRQSELDESPDVDSDGLGCTVSGGVSSAGIRSSSVSTMASPLCPVWYPKLREEVMRKIPDTHPIYSRPKIDYVYGTPIVNPARDHVVPVARAHQVVDCFDRLNHDEMIDVLNSDKNLQWMEKSNNSSKRHKLPAEWTGHSERPLNATQIFNLNEAFKTARDQMNAAVEAALNKRGYSCKQP